MNRHWLAPLTGVAFIVLLFVGFAIGGEPPDADEPVQEIIDHYVDNKDSIIVGAVVGGVGLMFLVFFGAVLRRILADAEGPGGILSPVVLVGTSMMALGGAIDTTIAIAIAEAAEDIEPSAVQALQALWDNDFIPIALGVELLLFSTGISIIRHGALPKWLGWVAIVLGVLGVTPIGFVAFLGGAVWILVISILLAVRARRGPQSAPPPAAPQPGV